jgi:hypothetical protein
MEANNPLTYAVVVHGPCCGVERTEVEGNDILWFCRAGHSVQVGPKAHMICYKLIATRHVQNVRHVVRKAVGDIAQTTVRVTPHQDLQGDDAGDRIEVHPQADVDIRINTIIGIVLVSWRGRNGPRLIYQDMSTPCLRDARILSGMTPQRMQIN